MILEEKYKGFTLRVLYSNDIGYYLIVNNPRNITVFGKLFLERDEILNAINEARRVVDRKRKLLE